MKTLSSLALAYLVLAIPPTAPAQTWTTLATRPPAGVGLCMLLTDGGVMCQSGANWYKLTPNASGSYASGTWSTLAGFPSGYIPDAFASAVLADGRVVVIGGEYNNNKFALSNQGYVYNPVANTWTALAPPPSTGTPNHWQCIGDAPATVLADGRFLLGSKLYQDVAVLDPSTMTWSQVSTTGKTDSFNSEEGWTLLPDGSFFTLDVANAPASERFLLTGSAAGVWASSGNTLQDLHTPTTSSPITAPGCPTYFPPGEIGPTLLRPDGTVFAVGASGFTGIYTPPAPGSTATGTWAAGPQMPAGLNVEDGPGAVLPSGNVLFGGSPGESSPGLKYFEFDGTNLNAVPGPARASSDATYVTSLMVLPTGQVLFVDGTTTVQVYTPAASPAYNPAWAPAISLAPSTVTSGSTYAISGTQFNGLDQGSAFGDESQNATNYPLVRITNNATGHVFYARTHGHSSMGVATGTATVSTNFDVPANIEAGASMIQVVANGIPSTGLAVTVTVNQNSTSTSVSSSANPSVFSQTVTFTATVTSGGGTPTGTVTFLDGTTTLGTSTLSNGRATLSTAALGVGPHSISAMYNGSSNFSTSTSGNLSQEVNQDGTSTQVSSSRNPAKRNQTVTFTARVSANAPGTGVPTGTVTFLDGTTQLGTVTLSGGSASLTPSSLSTGTHAITATYSGSSNFVKSTSPVLSQTVR